MSSVPTTMRAVVLDRPGTEGLSVREVPVPDLGPTDVLVRVTACGIGRTVLNKVRGLTADALPRIPGHEATGVVVATGDAADTVEVGSAVLLYYYLTCGECEHCWTGKDPLCDRLAGRHLRLGEDADGALAEYVKVSRRNILPLPDGLDPVAATTAPDAIATPLHIIHRVALAPGERILVVGAAGGVGVHLLQVARWAGARPIAVDLGDRLEGLERYGATDLVDASDTGWQEDLLGRVDVAVDLVGRPETLSAAFDTLGPSGRMALLTVDRDVSFPVAPWRMVGGERTLVGSKYASHAEVAKAAALLRDGEIEAVISTEVALDGAPDVLRSIERNDMFARGVMVTD